MLKTYSLDSYFLSYHLKDIQYIGSNGESAHLGLLLYEFMCYNQSKIHPCITVLYYLRVADLMGITFPYPRENIIASNYIFADTQAFLSKRHRQQNNEILIRHSPGIGGCFFAFKYSINRKNKKIFLRGL